MLSETLSEPLAPLPASEPAKPPAVQVPGAPAFRAAFSVQAEPGAVPPLSLITFLNNVKSACACGCCVLVTTQTLSVRVSISPAQSPE